MTGCAVSGISAPAFRFGRHPRTDAVQNTTEDDRVVLWLTMFAGLAVSVFVFAIGSGVGFQNSIGNLSGIVAPALTGFLVDRNGNFGAAFGIAAGVALFGVLCWSVLLGRIEMVDWQADRRDLSRAVAG